MKPSALLVLFAVFMTAADAPKELQGVWVVTKVEEGGKADDNTVGDTITIEGEAFKIHSKKDKKEVATGKFKFDGSKKPATVDMTVTRPDGKEATMNGLYQLDGDTVRFCFALGPPGKDRPKEISAKEDTVVITLKKEKK